MKALVRRLRRSLAAPLILLVAAFIAVPILFYLTFQQADLERQEMLLGSIQAQGRLVAAAVEPQLERASPDTFTDAAETLSHFSDGNARIRLLFRPPSFFEVSNRLLKIQLSLSETLYGW